MNSTRRARHRQKLLNKTGELDGSALKKVYIQLDQGDILQNHLSLIRQGIFFSSAETKYTYDTSTAGLSKSVSSASTVSLPRLN